MLGPMAVVVDHPLVAERLTRLRDKTTKRAEFRRNLAELTRYTRSGMISILQEDYMRTARAKGLSEIHGCAPCRVGSPGVLLHSLQLPA